MLELGWKRAVERLTERQYIQKIPFVLLIPEVELDHHVDRNAPHRAATDGSVTGQMMGMVGNASDVASGAVQQIGVNVDPAEIEVLPDPIVFPGVGGRDLLESHLG